MSGHSIESILCAADAEVGPACCDEDYQKLRLLMAATPDLLEMLEEARRTLEMWKDVAPAISLCVDIDKAIARARGESQ
jgi:hypothetical protein